MIMHRITNFKVERALLTIDIVDSDGYTHLIRTSNMKIIDTFFFVGNAVCIEQGSFYHIVNFKVGT